MKAAILEKTNLPLVIKNIQYMPLEYGQVLIKLHYSGVCHSQLMEARGNRGEDKFLPHLLGHEGTGEVIDIGDGVTKVKKGDKVILGWIKSSGIEANPPKYLSENQIINAGRVTTFNEMAVVSENRLTLLPEGIPFDIGVLFGCAIPTGAGIVINELQPKENAKIAVFGLGGIGLVSLMATNLYNPKMLIAVDVEDTKLELAKKFGATHTINPKKIDNVVQKIKELTEGGCDYCIEASGLANVIEQSFESLNNNGLTIFASHPKHGDKISLDPFDLICGKQIRGSWGGSSNPDMDIPHFAKLYLDGKLPLELLLSKIYSLDDINEALNDLENRKINRALIKM
ncbi:zinc-binding dehydrogenase [Arcobacter sp. FWKO B]|uniref:zinc-binding dehydrogenase n=1 Tax=Arcobacter sp. FWKO B TaxID=2593672 RepID=UPI0018A4EC0C|nr:zinc-binding dehydrogenase [Arcobacter sp. FWKO B]QOG12172.1 zinc-binding dehydrogenase [Arcobacter sp. FWKO B]